MTLILTPHDKPHGWSENGRGYVINDKLYHGVTSILKATKSSEDKKGLEAWKRRTSEADQQLNMDRGTTVHSEIEYYLKHGELREAYLMEAIKTKKGVVSPMAYIRGMEALLSRITQVHLIEGCVWSPRGYAGRVDAIVTINDEVRLVDWKTADRFKSSQQVRDYKIQLAAYCGALNHVYPTLKINKALIVVGVKDSPCQPFYVNEAEMLNLWQDWLKRLEKFNRVQR